MSLKIWSIDSIERYVYGTKSDFIGKEKKPTKCNNIIKVAKKINFDYVTKKHKIT